MIKLKTEVNKTQLLKELKESAETTYKDCYESESKVKVYMDGVKDLLEKLKEKKV
jgi:hypothetical protein